MLNFTGTREAPPWVPVLWDSVTGFKAKGGSIDDELLGRDEDLFPAVIWDWETACAKDFFGALLVFRGKGGIPLGKSLVGGRKGSVGGRKGRVGGREILKCSPPSSVVQS